MTSEAKQTYIFYFNEEKWISLQIGSRRELYVQNHNISLFISLPIYLFFSHSHSTNGCPFND